MPKAPDLDQIALSINREKKKAYAAAWHTANPEKQKAYSAKYRKANPEKAKAAHAAYRKANPEKEKASNAAWHKANPEKAKASVVKWRTANPKKVKAYSAKYWRANPDKKNTKGLRRRARQLGAPGSHTTAQWQELIAGCRGRCAYCEEVRPLTRDHLVPLARGGSNDIGNIIQACRSCNSSKGMKTLDVWMQLGATA